MSERNNAKCRSCSALTYWIETKAGKYMMVDREEVDPDDCDDGSLLVGDDGSTLRTGKDAPEEGVSYYLSHFATCPNADDHRRARNS